MIAAAGKEGSALLCWFFDQFGRINVSEPVLFVVGHIEVVADEVEEGGVADEVAGFVESLNVAGGFVLFDERDVLQMFEEAGVAFGDDDGQPVDQRLTAFRHEQVHSKLGNGFELCVGLG